MMWCFALLYFVHALSSLVKLSWSIREWDRMLASSWAQLIMPSGITVKTASASCPLTCRSSLTMSSLTMSSPLHQMSPVFICCYHSRHEMTSLVTSSSEAAFTPSLLSEAAIQGRVLADDINLITANWVTSRGEHHASTGSCWAVRNRL